MMFKIIVAISVIMIGLVVGWVIDAKILHRRIILRPPKKKKQEIKITPPRKVEFFPTSFSKYVSKKDNRYDHRIQEAIAMIENFPVDWRIIKALIKVESDFDPDAVSFAGALGLMQLMPDTANEVGVKDPFNPTENIRGGVKYFVWLWEQWKNIKTSDERLRLSLASYNTGYTYMRNARFYDWNLTQTWAYVDKILKWYKIYREMDND